jgi:anaerobic magnesium-protoporphyrin IX monomethyl ester cyclase
MKDLDILLIGHYDLSCEELYDALKGIGGNSGTFRDFNLGFVHYKEKPYSLTGLYNELVYPTDDRKQTIRLDNTFSATISYLGSYLNRHGLTFSYITSLNDEPERLEKVFEEYNVLSVAVLSTLYVSVAPVLEVIKRVRRFSSKAKILLGGPYVSTLVRTKSEHEVKHIFNNVIPADIYVNSSQGEATLVKILSAIRAGNSLEGIANIYYRSGKDIVKNAVDPESNPLHDNMVNWNLFEGDEKEFVNIRTAISCPFACAFCGFPENAGKYQTVEVALVEQELNTLTRINPKLKSIYFIDDTFNVPPKRFTEMLKMMIRNQYKFKWHSYIRCQFLDEETAKLLKEAGCEGAFLGVESGSDTILKNMNKKVTSGDYRRGIKLLKNAGIVTFGSFIIGFPGENLKTVLETSRFIEETGLDFFRAQLWFCEHITPIWRQRDTYSIEGEGYEWKHSTMNSKVACGIIDKMFLNTKNSVWLPQYDFDFENVWRVVHSGKTIEQTKQIVKLFNEGIRSKLIDPSIQNISEEVIEKLTNEINQFEVVS